MVVQLTAALALTPPGERIICKRDAPSALDARMSPALYLPKRSDDDADRACDCKFNPLAFAETQTGADIRVAPVVYWM
jgi:hypothetical protein